MNGGAQNQFLGKVLSVTKTSYEIDEHTLSLYPPELRTQRGFMLRYMLQGGARKDPRWGILCKAPFYWIRSHTHLSNLVPTYFDCCLLYVMHPWIKINRHATKSSKILKRIADGNKYVQCTGIMLDSVDPTHSSPPLSPGSGSAARPWLRLLWSRCSVLSGSPGLQEWLTRLTQQTHHRQGGCSRCSQSISCAVIVKP